MARSAKLKRTDIQVDAVAISAVLLPLAVEWSCPGRGAKLTPTSAAADFGDQIDFAVGVERDEVGVLEDLTVDRHRHAFGTSTVRCRVSSALARLQAKLEANASIYGTNCPSMHQSIGVQNLIAPSMRTSSKINPDTVSLRLAPGPPASATAVNGTLLPAPKPVTVAIPVSFARGP